MLEVENGNARNLPGIDLIPVSALKIQVSNFFSDIDKSLMNM